MGVAESAESADGPCEQARVCGPHISAQEIRAFSPQAHGSWEDYVMRRWTTGRNGDSGSEDGAVSDDAAGFEEYARARRRICLDDGLMQESRAGRTVCYLASQREPFQGMVWDVLDDFYEVFEPSLLLALKKAFGLRTDVAARNEGRPVPVVADFAGNFFDAAVNMWASLPLWKKPVMSAALRELFRTEDATGLQVILGMIKSAVQHCDAGRVDVWNRMLLRVVPALPGASAQSPCDVNGTQGPARGRLSEARRALWEAALVFADDWKEKALMSTFLEPTKMYYHACGERSLAENVEVHGSSVYLAVLLSTLGVRCPRTPFLLDTPISTVSFLDALERGQVRALWSPENFGKPFSAVPECRVPRLRATLANHYSNFLFSGRQPWQIANSAVDASNPVDRRRKLQPYLEQFSNYFSEEFLVPRLTQHLLQQDELRHALQVVLDSVLALPGGSGGRGPAATPREATLDAGSAGRAPRPEDAGARPGRGAAAPCGSDEHREQRRLLDRQDSEDVRYWLWDLEVLPAELRHDRAALLLQSAGIMKAPAAV